MSDGAYTRAQQRASWQYGIGQLLIRVDSQRERYRPVLCDALPQAVLLTEGHGTEQPFGGQPNTTGNRRRTGRFRNGTCCATRSCQRVRFVRFLVHSRIVGLQHYAQQPASERAAEVYRSQSTAPPVRTALQEPLPQPMVPQPTDDILGDNSPDLRHRRLVTQGMRHAGHTVVVPCDDMPGRSVGWEHSTVGGTADRVENPVVVFCERQPEFSP